VAAAIVARAARDSRRVICGMMHLEKTGNTRKNTRGKPRR